MIIKNTPQTKVKERKAFYFYPNQKYFKVDNSDKQQLNNPILIFKESFPGQCSHFTELIKKEADKVGDSAKFYSKLTYSFLKKLFDKAYSISLTF